MIKDRYLKLIKLTLNNNEIDLKEVSDILKVTERSIRYDIEEINETFNEKVISIDNNYLKLLVKKNKILNYISSIKINDYYFTEEERNEILIYEIFLLRNEFTLDYIENKYQVSKSTIRKSIKQINEELSHFSLYLDFNNSKSYKIVGEELDIRKYIINILKNYFKLIRTEELIPKFKKYIVDEFLNNINIDRYKTILTEIKINTNKSISDEAYEILNLFLIISEKRNNKQKIKNVDNSYFIKETSEYIKIKSIIDNFEMNLTEKDIIYFTDIFIGSCTYNNNYSLFLNWVMIETLVYKFLNKISKNLSMDLSNDKILQKELINHLKPAIYRIINKLKITESIYDDVRKEFPEIYETKDALYIISDFININFDEDEVAFITIMIYRAIVRKNSVKNTKTNILIVCGLGYSTSRFVYENINNVFNVNVIDIIPYNELEEYEYLKKADLIISTLNFKLEGIDVVTVNAVMSDKDIEALKNYGLQERKTKIYLSELIKIIKKSPNDEQLIENIKTSFGKYIIDDTKERKENKSLSSLLNINRVQIYEKIEDIDDGLEKVVNLMVNEKLVKTEYLEELKNQVKQYGEYILLGKRTILPHGQMLKNVYKTGFSIIVIKKGVKFFEEQINIIICLASRSVDEHIQAILELNEYLKNEKFEKDIIEMEDEKKIIEYIKSLERRDINE